MNHSSSTSLYLSLARQFLYIVVLVLVVLIFWQLADIFKSGTVQEYGVFESIQSVVLLLITTSFLFQTIRNKEYRPILYSLAALAAAALIREQDAYFDNLFPGVGWSWCWIFPIVGLIILFRHRHTMRGPMHIFLQSNSFRMMLTAVVIILPVAQCLGHRSFLSDMMGDDRVNSFLMRRILEEPIELLGYIQILLASVECMIEFRRK